MAHAPVHVIDTAFVAAADAGQLVALVREEQIPVMRDAGAELLSCLATSAEVGEEVRVQTIWRVSDHAAWNRVRMAYFLDSRWHTMCARLAALRTGGDRRFYYPVADV